MGLMLSDSGKLMLRNGKLFDDVNGTDCCCGDVCACDCQYLQDKWDNVQGLTAEIDWPAGCGGFTQTLALAHSGQCNNLPGGNEDCPVWGVLDSHTDFGDFNICVYCNRGTLKVLFSQVTLAGASCKITEEGTPVEPDSLVCDNDSMLATFTLNIEDGPGMIACGCIGSTVTVRVY